MEIRGLGIIDVRQMFGIRSIRYQKRLEIVVELLEWNSSEEYQRIGLDEQDLGENGSGYFKSSNLLSIFPKTHRNCFKP